jgi:succinate dehydrogenase hydrophobic anchor subunit
MGILAVAAVASISATVAATISVRKISSGSASCRDLWFAAATAIFLAFLLSVCLLFWQAVLGGDFKEFMLPDLLATRPERVMFTVYILASAGLATGVVALFASFLTRRRTA